MSYANVSKFFLTRHTVVLPEKLLCLMDQILKIELQSVKISSWQDFENINELPEISFCKISIWKGDICTLSIDAIVNAANSGMLGCFSPNHPCIDNIIHDRAGPRLRAECREIMEKQQSPEETGKAKLTRAYCLPSQHVLHTVGPIFPEVGLREDLLESCYVSCLELAKANGLKSIAFCCISTGIFGFPQLPAARVALRTVRDWLKQESNHQSFDCIVFNVFKNEDYEIYNNNYKQYYS